LLYEAVPQPQSHGAEVGVLDVYLGALGDWVVSEELDVSADVSVGVAYNHFPSVRVLGDASVAREWAVVGEVHDRVESEVARLHF